MTCATLARKGRFAYVDLEDRRVIQIMSGMDQQLDELYRAINALCDDLTALQSSVTVLQATSSPLLLTVTFTAVGVNQTFTHTLGSVPVSFVQAQLAGEAPGFVYLGTTAATAGQITLRSTTLGPHSILLLRDFSSSILADFTTTLLTAFTFTGVGVDHTFAHGLGTTPTALLRIPMASETSPAHVYFGSVAATSTQITLRSTTTGSRGVLLAA